MDAHACHGCLRTQRCLPAEFHTEVPTLTYRETGPATPICRRSDSVVPQVAVRIVIALMRANSRFFTDCYPISAAFRPRRDPNPASKSTVKRLSLELYQTNITFSFQWLG